MRFLAMHLLAAISCSSLAACEGGCPTGTVQEGNICKRAPASDTGNAVDEVAQSDTLESGRSTQMSRMSSDNTSMARAGAEAPSEDTSSGTTWTCANVDQSCTCVSGLGDNDLCSNKPDCCFTLPSLMSCQCWPKDHENCATFMMEDPNGKRVPTCPPP